jgi:DNA (cytosine-5)-methyltransferase 1
MKKIKAKAISLFSGCGGSDLGLKNAGFDILLANDTVSYACTTYKLNMPETEVKCCHIKKLTKFPSAELLVGCYPCQGFSQGGARDSSRKINYLYREFDRILRIIKPKAFIVENVPGMGRSNFKHLLDEQINLFTKAGYRVTPPPVLNACDYGVPQTRKRIFIVGIQSGLGVQYNFPELTHGPGRHLPYLTQRDVLNGLPDWPEGEFYNKEFHWYYLSRNRRRDWDEPSATILSNPRHMPLHPSSPPLVKHGHNDWRFEYDGPARRFSYREAALLQGFPKSFAFPENGSLAQKYKTIGNAVPPPFFETVVKALPEIW